MFTEFRISPSLESESIDHDSNIAYKKIMIKWKYLNHMVYQLK